jgi:hypothetical protein
MIAFLENNPTLAFIAGVLILVTIALHVGAFVLFRRLSRAKAANGEVASDSEDSNRD